MSIPRFVPQTSFGRLAISLLAMTCAAPAWSLNYSLGTITGEGMTFLTPTTGFGYAGQIHLTTLFETLDVWCIDLTDNFIQSGATYNAESSAYLLLPPALTGLPDLQRPRLARWGR
jgi:hypothetical protein